MASPNCRGRSCEEGGPIGPAGPVARSAGWRLLVGSGYQAIPPPAAAGFGATAVSLKQKVNWPYADRLLNLLKSGEHEFLKGLIDRLHEASCSNQRGEPASTVEDAHKASDPLPEIPTKQIDSETLPTPPASRPVGGKIGETPLARRTRRRLKAT